MIIVTEAELKRNYIRKDQLVSVLNTRAAALSTRIPNPPGALKPKTDLDEFNERLAAELYVLANAIQNLP